MAAGEGFARAGRGLRDGVAWRACGRPGRLLAAVRRAGPTLRTRRPVPRRWTGPQPDPSQTLLMRVFAPRAARVAAILILTASAACDNVEWGGASVQIVSPPPAGGAAVTAPEPGTVSGLGLPTGPVLFHVVRNPNGTARLIPVLEIGRDSVRTLRRPSGVATQAYEPRFRAAVMEPNAQF